MPGSFVTGIFYIDPFVISRRIAIINPQKRTYLFPATGSMPEFRTRVWDMLSDIPTRRGFLIKDLL